MERQPDQEQGRPGTPWRLAVCAALLGMAVTLQGCSGLGAKALSLGVQGCPELHFTHNKMLLDISTMENAIARVHGFVRATTVDSPARVQCQWNWEYDGPPLVCKRIWRQIPYLGFGAKVEEFRYVKQSDVADGGWLWQVQAHSLRCRPIRNRRIWELTGAMMRDETVYWTYPFFQWMNILSWFWSSPYGYGVSSSTARSPAAILAVAASIGTAFLGLAAWSSMRGAFSDGRGEHAQMERARSPGSCSEPYSHSVVPVRYAEPMHTESPGPGAPASHVQRGRMMIKADGSETTSDDR
mmetsp:Transcript_66606/g.171416  ORF Transcript_66606/g.171416 Transcript_66606/m.171416 type:complete len:297 (-) Transcript_66606:279-1169(-)